MNITNLESGPANRAARLCTKPPVQALGMIDMLTFLQDLQLLIFLEKAQTYAAFFVLKTLINNQTKTLTISD